MNKLTTICIAALFGGLGSSAFGATVTATPTAFSVSIGLSGFTVDFADGNSDNLLEYDEITAFSGITYSFGPDPFAVTTVPDIIGISLFSYPLFVGQPADFWRFGTLVGTSVFSRDSWTYEIALDDPAPSVVPLPASLPLMMGAIAVFGFMRRRKAIS